MKRSTLRRYSALAASAVGVFLGRGAQADTVLDFNSFPPGQGNNSPIIAGFGSNAGASSPGVSVFGLGTPNIALAFQGSGAGSGTSVTRWDYYIDAVWSAGQLNGSRAGEFHSLVFTPSLSAAVSIGSFNFHPYYASAETFDYHWSVLDGANVLASGSSSFGSDGTANHPVTINFTGNLGEALTLRWDRVGGTGDGQNIAVDDIRFAQVPEPSIIALLSLGGLAGLGLVARRRASRDANAG